MTYAHILVKTKTVLVGLTEYRPLSTHSTRAIKVGHAFSCIFCHDREFTFRSFVYPSANPQPTKYNSNINMNRMSMYKPQLTLQYKSLICMPESTKCTYRSFVYL